MAAYVGLCKSRPNQRLTVMKYSLLVWLVVTAGCQAHEGASRPVRARHAMMAKAAVPQLVADAAPPTAFGDDSGSSTSMIIRTGDASIEVDSVDHAIALVRELARAAGGYIGNSSITHGEDNVRSATLGVQVPEERFDRVLGGLAPIGRVESVSVNAQDVGEEYVDYEGRLANARRMEERLIALLATRTGKLKDVLDVEQELARARGDIEHYEGHLRYLQAHAAMSTLAITVHEHAPVLAEAPGQHPIREAAHQAWRNFVGLVAFGVASLGIVLPLGALGLGGWLGIALLRRVGGGCT